MPIMGLSEYINDFTINNMNKTMTLFHQWVELSGLETMHRGIIFDTECNGELIETISTAHIGIILSINMPWKN